MNIMEPIEELSEFEDASSDSASEIGNRYCWVCLEYEVEAPEAEWVQPCRCRGSTKWVHHACLNRWISEKLLSSTNMIVYCPQCKTAYLLDFPDMGKVVFLIDVIDCLVTKAYGFMGAGLIIGVVYWASATYGSIAMMQIFGTEDGMAIMTSGEPAFLLVALPVVPTVLLLGRTFEWEDYVLDFLNSVADRIPLVRRILPFDLVDEEPPPAIPNPDNEPERETLRGRLMTYRIFCGALFLPTMACCFGNLLFSSVNCHFHRVLLGGCTFLAIKGSLRIYYKQKQLMRQRQRRILDHTDENLAMYLNNAFHRAPFSDIE